MKPFVIHTTGEASWYRFHHLEKNFSIKVIDDPFDGLQVQEIKLEWGGGKSVPKILAEGDEFDRVKALFLAAM